MHSRLLIAGIGAILVGFVGLGCGGPGSGDDNSVADQMGESPQVTVSKEKFVRKADEACSEVAKKREAAATAWRKKYANEFVDDHIDDAFREVIAPAIREQVEALESLPAPAGEEEKVNRMIANLSQVEASIERRGAAGTKLPELFEFEREAAGFGLKACSRLF